jgi:protein TonB
MKLILCYIVCVTLRAVLPLSDFQDDKIYTVSEVNTKPEPIAGHDTFQRKWSKRVTYPEEAIRAKIEGVVFIEFVVEKDGSITEAAVRNGLGHGCDEAALEGFKEASINAWKPGIKQEQPVRVKMVLPFQFRILKL